MPREGLSLLGEQKERSGEGIPDSQYIYPSTDVVTATKSSLEGVSFAGLMDPFFSSAPVCRVDRAVPLNASGTVLSRGSFLLFFLKDMFVNFLKKFRNNTMKSMK